MIASPDAAFVFWEPFIREGGLVALAPYHTKYRGGASPRDAMAMAKVFGSLSRLCPDVPIDIRITDRLLVDDRRRNLVLIASASGNAVVREFLKELENYGTPLSFSLGQGYWVDAPRDNAGLSMNLVSKSVAGEADRGAQHSIEDIGLVARARNPYNPSSVVTFVAGIHGYGTLAAAEVFFGRKYQRTIQELLSSENVGFDPDTDRDAIVEVILKASIGQDQSIIGQTMRPLTDISIQFVRVRGSLSRQSSFPDIWRMTAPQPRIKKNPYRFSVFLDEMGRDSRALVRLQGRAHHTHFIDLDLRNADCTGFSSAFDTALAASAPMANSRVKDLADELRRQLLPVMDLAPGIGAAMRPDELVYTFGAGAEYLGVPFELVRLKNRQYLGLVHPVVRSINGFVCEKSPPDEGALEELRQQQQPLRILLVASNPRGDLPNAVAEAERVKNCLLPFEPYVKTVSLVGKAATVAAFKARVNHHHMLHYIGHSSWSKDRPGESYLLLQDSEGNLQPLLLAELNQVLSDKSSLLSFCYLSSCEGTATGDHHDSRFFDFLGMADSFVRAGIPSILGFRNRVDDHLAEEFAAHFYSNLWQPRREFNIPRALLYARQKIAETRLAEAFSPILVMQG